MIIIAAQTNITINSSGPGIPISNSPFLQLITLFVRAKDCYQSHINDNAGYSLFKCHPFL